MAIGINGKKKNLWIFFELFSLFNRSFWKVL